MKSARKAAPLLAWAFSFLGLFGLSSCTTTTKYITPVLSQAPSPPKARVLEVQWVLNVPTNSLVGVQVFPKPGPWGSPVPMPGEVEAAELDPYGVSVFLVVSHQAKLYNFFAGRVVASFPSGPDPVSLALAPDGTAIYVGDGSLGDLYVINNYTGRLFYKIHLGQSVTYVLAPPHDPYVFALDSQSGTLFEINPGTRSVQQELSLGGSPTELQLDPVTHNIGYVLDPAQQRLDVVDMANLSLVGAIDLPVPVLAFAVDPDGVEAYAVQQGSPNLLEINLATGSLSEGPSFGSPVNSVVSLANGNLLVATQGALFYYSPKQQKVLTQYPLPPGPNLIVPYVSQQF